MDPFLPIERLAEWLAADAFGIASPYWRAAVSFFLYDTVKIGLLLVAVNYVMAVFRHYLPVGRVRDLVAGRRRWAAYLLAALLGAVTPFCSCSSIPLFVGFMAAGIPLGVTFTFLVSSPLINEASLFIFPSVFGLPLTAAYLALGVLLSVLVGVTVQRLRIEGNVNPAFLRLMSGGMSGGEAGGAKEPPLAARLKGWWREGMAITKSVFPYVLLGVGLGALIHGFVPQEAVESGLKAAGPLAVPLAVVLGLPLYANSVGVIPVIEALTGKGVAVGTALAFMTATVTLSLPALLILKKAISWRLLLAFVISTAIGIMAIGYSLNALSGILL